jgi:preprotein translocase subunit SecE
LRVQVLPHLLRISIHVSFDVERKVDMIKKLKQFIDDVQVEMKKVSWPTWEELKGSTYVVLSLSLVLAIFLFFVDFVLGKVLSFIL